jgi:steroid 5-alpha reductase family enzyme
MTKAEKISALAIPVILLLGVGLGSALSSNSVVVGGWPLLGLMFALAFAIQWLVFIPSYLFQTERFFDLTGSLTYISIAALTFVLNPVSDARAALVAAMVIIWAMRLGSFLFKRIHRDGKDGRFDEIKPSFIRFFMTWSLQGLWVALTAACALVVLSSPVSHPLSVFAVLGSALWVLGMFIEVVADTQKSRFKADASNQGQFIDTGLWSISRHPNYAGEILLWLGIAVIALPVLQGFQWLALISPVFVYLLLRYISGVPMLEKRSDQRWGEEEAYQRYKAKTRLLWPIPKAAQD